MRRFSTLVHELRKFQSDSHPDLFEAEKQLSRLLKRGLDSPDAARIIPEIAPSINAIPTSSRFDAPRIVSHVVQHSLDHLTSVLRDPDSMKNLIQHSNESDFIDILREICSNFSHKIPPALIEHIPSIESRILQSRCLEDAQSIGVVVDTIAKLKLSNGEIFQKISQTVVDLLEKNAQVHKAVILKLVREMGWGGYMHSDLLRVSTPLFHLFKQYQGLSSVWMIAGGLTPEIVEIVMESVRNDLKRNNPKYPITLDGHCQLIRRLVVGGFFKAAMELFHHFPASAYQTVDCQSSVSQISRLFHASFLDPVTVPSEEVAFLKPDPSKHETTSVMYHGGESSSYIHTLAVSALKRLKEVHVSEYVDEPTQLTVDIYIPDRNLVIEVQGPSHYITDLKTGQTHLRQEDEFKLSVLKKRGYNVELISIHDFGRKNATRNADNMIGDIVNRWPLVSR